MAIAARLRPAVADAALRKSATLNCGVLAAAADATAACGALWVRSTTARAPARRARLEGGGGGEARDGKGEATEEVARWSSTSTMGA